MRQAFINDISNQLGAMNLSSEDPEENWTVFQKVVHSSAATTIGHPSRKHQDWFDENDEGTTLLRLVLLPCYRMMKSGTFSKRTGAATKGIESCEFWFQVAFFQFKYSFVFSGIVCVYERR